MLRLLSLAALSAPCFAAVLAGPVVDEPIIFSGQIRDVASVAFAPDGSWLATGGMDGAVTLWSANSCDGKFELGKHDGNVSAIAFSADGKRLATGDVYKSLKLWTIDAVDPKASKEESSRKLGGAIDALAFAPDGKALYLGSRDNAELIVDPSAGAADSDPRSLSHEYEVQALAVTSDGKHFASGDGGGNVRLWQFDEHHEVKEGRAWKHEGRITSLVFTTDGKTLFCASSAPSLNAIETATGKPRDGFDAKGVEANALALTADGTVLIAGTQDGFVKLIDPKSGRVTKTLEGHEGPVTSIGVSPDGRIVASASLDRSVKVWLIGK